MTIHGLGRRFTTAPCRRSLRRQELPGLVRTGMGRSTPPHEGVEGSLRCHAACDKSGSTSITKAHKGRATRRATAADGTASKPRNDSGVSGPRWRAQTKQGIAMSVPAPRPRGGRYRQEVIGTETAAPRSVADGGRRCQVDQNGPCAAPTDTDSPPSRRLGRCQHGAVATTPQATVSPSTRGDHR
jgi:hypothetical protein